MAAGQFTPKLTEEQQIFLVTAAACFDGPAVAARALKEEFGVECSKQLAEAYDPTKRAARSLAKRWKVLFEETRKQFLNDTAAIGISHRTVRLRALQRMADKAEAMGNMALAKDLHRQAAEEVGGIYTNHRHISDANGGPLMPTTIQIVAAQPASRADGDD